MYRHMRMLDSSLSNALQLNEENEANLSFEVDLSFTATGRVDGCYNWLSNEIPR